MERKPVLLSGIQPSGNLMIGNYLGALKNWVSLQDKYDCLFVLVDLHAITVRQDTTKFRSRCYDFIAQYIASGIDPEKSTIFIQSHVPAHTELAWVLNCYTYMGELSRMTQYKDKIKKHKSNINVGLFAYPVLMAADILLYQTNLVPVGEDQKQHLELCRDIAQRFNRLYGEVFQIPEPYIPPVGARIMSLQEPTKKMSKSDENSKNYIALLDPPFLAKSKIKKAVTDMGSEIKYDPEEKPGISNLISIHSALTGTPIEKIEEKYKGKGYKDFKEDLADIVSGFLTDFQEKYKKIRENKKGLKEVLKKGSEDANRRANKTLRKVYKKLGFIPKL